MRNGNLGKTETDVRKFFKTYWLGIAAMAGIVTLSNILVQFLYGNWLTWGAFTYPLAFLVTDVMNRVYGARVARRVVFVGFVTGVICSLIGTQVMLHGDGYTYQAVTVRIALGSGLAFLSAQLLDIAIFNRLRGNVWWQAPLASSVIGSAVDTALFFSIAFSASFAWIHPATDVSWTADILPILSMGPEAPLWVSLAIADYGVKLGLALLALIPFRLIVARLSRTQLC